MRIYTFLGKMGKFLLLAIHGSAQVQDKCLQLCQFLASGKGGGFFTERTNHIIEKWCMTFIKQVFRLQSVRSWQLMILVLESKSIV